MEEQLQQQEIKAEYMHSKAQTQAAADNQLQRAYEVIHGLEGTVLKQEQSQAELNGAFQSLRATIEKQDLHHKEEADSARRRRESEIHQLEAQQARQAQEYQRQQRERENELQREINRLTADLLRYTTSRTSEQ